MVSLQFLLITYWVQWYRALRFGKYSEMKYVKYKNIGHWNTTIAQKKRILSAKNEENAFQYKLVSSALNETGDR